MHTVIDVLKEKYEYENERKRYYDNVITLPVSLIAFIITGTYFIISEQVTVAWFNQIKPILIFDLLAASIISMFFLFRVFYGHKRVYRSFPSSATVLSDYNSIQILHKGEEALIEKVFINCITTWYTKINDENILVNDLRAEYFHLSKRFIGISYGIGILLFILYCYIKFN